MSRDAGPVDPMVRFDGAAAGPSADMGQAADAPEADGPPCDPADGLPPEADLADALGRSVAEVLDLRTWSRDGGLPALLEVADRAVADGIAGETRMREAIRREVLGRLADFPAAPPGAGLWRASEDRRRAARRDVLMAGRAAAVAGACRGYEGLSAAVATLGVAAVRYDGRAQTWRTSFRRSDHRVPTGDAVADLRAFLDRRAGRDDRSAGGEGDRVSDMMRRGLLAAAERRALLDEGPAAWKLGRGLPAPLELLTGSGSASLLDHALPILERLLLAGDRWAFLPDSTASRALSTLAGALEPGEIAVFQRHRVTLSRMLEIARVPAGRRAAVEGLAARLGESAAVCGFRATPYAPGRVYVAPAATALHAGLLLAADAELQPHAGRPLLADLAALSARNGLGADLFAGVVQAAHVRRRAGGLFAPERGIDDGPAEPRRPGAAGA